MLNDKNTKARLEIISKLTNLINLTELLNSESELLEVKT
jgi:hypothetical protein